MIKLKQILTLGFATFIAPMAQAALVNFHFGSSTQTGGAALGGAGDLWNASNVTNGSLLLKDATGAATAISATWTSDETWSGTHSIFTSRTGTQMDAATTPLMASYAESYAFTTAATHLAVTISGLVPSKTYTLVLYGAGDLINQGTAFTVAGSSKYWVSTQGVNRMISDGIGNAYTVVNAVSSSTGTLAITTKQGNTPHAVMNGFQIALGVVTPNVTIVPTKPSPMKIWGVCGHPTLTDYGSWQPGNVATQMSDLKSLGAGFYRTSFQGSETPANLDTLEPQAMANGITLLPDVPVHFVASDDAQTNYTSNYTIAYNWAAYAIAKGYPIPYWELGNEPENGSCVSIVGDGSSPANFPDKAPGGFVAIASGLDGAYDGINQAYADGRAAGTTTITPQCLMGMCYRHWGLLAKILAYNNGVLPCDILSWHWYGPSYGDFNLPCNAPGQADNGRIPAACLADFKSRTDPTKPMDVWITETNRQEVIGGLFYNGSTASRTDPLNTHNWTGEASAIWHCIESFKQAPNVKGIFVFELYDETHTDGWDLTLLASQGYYGIITGLNGIKKNAFYTLQGEIKYSK